MLKAGCLDFVRLLVTFQISLIWCNFATVLSFLPRFWSQTTITSQEMVVSDSN